MSNRRRELFDTHSVEETEAVGRALAASLRAGDVVALSGGLGAGKTAFVRGVAAALAPEAHVSSPTFALVHRYEGSPALYHFDLYRLSDEDELVDIGFFDYLREQAILLIEWSELAPTLMPEQRVTVTLEPLVPGGNDRRIIIEWGGPHADSGY